jgi:hypothetical protein
VVSSKSGEGILESRGTISGFKGSGSIQSDERTLMENRDAVGEKLNFRKCVGGKQERSSICREDFRLEEAPEVRGGKGIQAARGFIQEQDPGLVQKGTEKAEALDGAGGERAKLPVEG